MKIKDLVAALKTKDQNIEAQFIVTDKSDGSIVCMDLQGRNVDVGKLIKFFAPPERKSGPGVGITE